RVRPPPGSGRPGLPDRTGVRPRAPAGDGGVIDRRAGAARLDAAAVADGIVADEGAVEDDQGALGVLVAEAATYPTGEVVGEGAAGDGDGAVAGVADSAADVVCGDGRVVADQGPRDGQVGALEHVAHLDGVEPDAGALIHGGVTSDHRASVDEDLARAIGLNAAAGVTGAVVANRG